MTDAMHRVLIVEDDAAIRQVLVTLYETNGFRVVTAETCEVAERRARSYRPDICIVDLGLPDRDGLNFVRGVREWSPVPLVVLTARADESMRLAAFEAGADDYVSKPFSGPELLARTRAILRRVTRGERPGGVIRIGRATVDLANRTTRDADGREIKLTPIEHRILECFARHADSVVTRERLLREVWGPHQADVRSLRVYVASLRRKLEVDSTRPRHILTEAGIGYRLATDGESAASEDTQPAA